MTLSASALALAAGAARAEDTAGIGDTSKLQERTPVTSRVVPLTSRFALNNEVLQYGQGPSLSGVSLTGSSRDRDLDLSGTLPLRQSMRETMGNGLYLREQSGWYLQGQSVDRRRSVTTTRREAVDVLGFQLDLTVTGGCFFQEAEADSYCTYTPSMEIDPDSIAPDTLVPGAFVLGETVGTGISQATHEALKAEGFQRGDEDVGLSLNVPNSGYDASAERSGLNAVERYESVEQRLVGGLYKFDQTLSSNAEGASLARTTRGLVFLDSDEWTSQAAAVQMLAWLLPSARAPLQGAEGDARLSISNNLFLAANNTRLPADSFTAYHAGTGRVAHPKGPVRSAAETPRSIFNSVWLGFSPVRDITTSRTSRLETTGPRESALIGGYSFAQGDIDSALANNTAIFVVDEISERISQLELANIDDLFVQSGLNLTSQDALAIYTSTETSRYRYVPHLSFSGNVTTGTSVLRYYAGAIVDEDTNAYVGFDHTYSGPGGLSVYLHAQHYSKPDRDYYSKVEARVSKTVSLGNGSALRFGVSATEDLNRAPAEEDSVTLNDNARVLDFAAGYQTASGVIYSVNHRLVQEEDGESTESTSLGLSYKVSDAVSLTSEITPSSGEDAYVAARAGVSWRPGTGPLAPVLGVQWASIRYDYGEDQFGNSLRDREDILLVSYKIKF